MAISVEGFELIQSLRDGNNDLFEEVVREYRPELMRHAQRKMHNDAAAEDVVQETFARAFRALGRLRDDSNIRPWLHHICANVCIDEANRRLRETDKVTRLHIDPLWNRDLAPGVEDQLGLTIDDTPLQTALDSLSPEHRSALVLRFVDELEYDELAARSGISEQNARARVSRARTMVRVALNGAAAIPLFLYGLFRRSPRAAALVDKADALSATQAPLMSSANIGHLGRIATAVAPAVEAAGAVAASAPAAAPMLAKVAVGVGLVATATFATTGSESPAQRIEFTTGAVVVDASATDAQATGTELPVAGMANDDTSDGDASATVTAAADTAATGTGGAAAVDTAAGDATGVTADDTATDAPATGGIAAGSAGGAPVTTAPATTAAPTTTVVGAAGDVAVLGLELAVAGPRLDLSGPATLTIGDDRITGRIAGRVSIASSLDRAGRQRVDGTLTFSFDGGTVQLRLAGFATELPPAVEPPAEEPVETLPAAGGDDTATAGTGNDTGDGATGGDAAAALSGTASSTMSAVPAATAVAATASPTTTTAPPATTLPAYRLSGRFTTVGTAHGLLSSGAFAGMLSATDLTLSFGS